MKENNSKRWEEFNAIVEATDLNLKEKGLLLILFRYVNYEKGYANPSRALIKKLTGISDNRTLDKILNHLSEMGYIKKVTNKGIRTKYYIYAKVGTEIEPSVKNVPGGEITPSGEITPGVGGKITPGVGGEITPQKENKRKQKKIYIDLTFIDDVVKIERVKLTQEQYDTLKDKYGESKLHNTIVSLDAYITDGKKYKDHYRTLNNWLRKNKEAMKDKNVSISKEAEPIKMEVWG